MIWFIRSRLRPHRKGLSLPQFRALVLVDRTPCSSLSCIADNLGASLPTTSRLVAGLVSKGYVARKGCDDDRRQLSLAITRRGREMLDSAWASVQQQMQSHLEPLTEAQRQTVYDAMKVLQGTFGKLELPDRENPCATANHANGGSSGAGKPRHARS